MSDQCIWDAGPVAPQRPSRPAVLTKTPELAPGAEGPPDYEPALRRYAEAYSHYLRALDSFPAERAAWEAEHGKGPIEVVVNSAAEVIERDPQRYSIRRPAA
jgi:hypothetical protein